MGAATLGGVMLPLKNPNATPEQLTIITDDDPGPVLIRGAAGSGKTSTALLRLSYLSSFWMRRNRRLGISTPVRVLVLTFNRTLAGYVQELAIQQIPQNPLLQLSVSTVSGWAKEMAAYHGHVLDNVQRANILKDIIRKSSITLDPDFLVDEVDYLLGRYEPAELKRYLTDERRGRGLSPRVDGAMRARILDEVVQPYTHMKDVRTLFDWNDIALAAMTAPRVGYEVVIVDEAQDFSTNQVRAVLSHVGPEYSLTFVTDTTQRIYPRYVSFAEAGIPRFRRTHSLKRNYRNTREIALFAQGIVTGVRVDEDGSLPDPAAAARSGPAPVVLEGLFNQQMDWIVEYLQTQVDLANESVGFLMVNGGGWFDEVRTRLNRAGIPFVELQQNRNWPTGPEAVALSTFHSAKGLEFDHVIIPGLRERLGSISDAQEDDRLLTLRRLLAMGVGRARNSVVVGYKPQEASDLVRFFQAGTFRGIVL